MVLLQGQVQQLRHIQRDLLLHQAVDAQAPSLRSQLRDSQGRIDPVELVIGSDERLHAVEVQDSLCGDLCGLDGRGGKNQLTDGCPGGSGEGPHRPSQGE